MQVRKEKKISRRAHKRRTVLSDVCLIRLKRMRIFGGGHEVHACTEMKVKCDKENKGRLGRHLLVDPRTVEIFVLFQMIAVNAKKNTAIFSSVRYTSTLYQIRCGTLRTHVDGRPLYGKGCNCTAFYRINQEPSSRLVIAHK